jgi:hypothetical protein
MDFWMFKVTAGKPDVPDRTEAKPSDFALNPLILRVIGSAIEIASGLTTDEMFTPPEDRLEHTIMWALDQLINKHSEGVQQIGLEHIRARFKRIMEEAREAEEAQEAED